MGRDMLHVWHKFGIKMALIFIDDNVWVRSPLFTAELVPSKTPLGHT